MAAVAVIRLYSQPILKKLLRRKVHVVASCAIDLLVRAAQRKIGLAVIETAEGCQGRKGLLIMALLTVRSQLAIVWILMATVAVGKGYTGKNLKLLAISRFFLVAVHTTYFRMLTQQGKISAAVIELGGWCKRFRSMTLRTLIGQGALVVIFVAGLACLIKTQIGVRALAKFCIAYVVRLMTVSAIYALVSTRKWVACQFVVKIFLIKANRVKIETMVLAVTGGALFANNIARSVVAGFLIDE
jgi:hypothetical protein